MIISKKIKLLMDAWQTMNNKNIQIEDILKYDSDLYTQLTNLLESLNSDGYIDFSFAISLTIQELKKIDKKEGSYLEKFKYLFVDEYQDINPIQCYHHF